MSPRLRSAALATLLFAVPVFVGAVDKPSFQREVRPILSEHCFRCHGFDEHARQAQLRLDRSDGATTPAESGTVAVVPGRPNDSELIRRITSHDSDKRMPPADTGKSLTATQIETLRRWIEQGAEYTQHWAFAPPIAHPLPAVRQQNWPRNEIDAAVLSRLETLNLQPAAEADPARLLRRVSLDLTGLPPTLEELDEFLAAHARDPNRAYEDAVDRLLNSPHYGERMAIDWLDAARYADTNGYFGDKPRQAWPWRDWVIRAFNDNMPFDRFTIEQLAGDLLPESTRDQKVATGFHRNSMANNETGIIDEEYRVEAVADRVDTTSTVWLGLTVGCAQCHDHKYDPISQREYYQLFAYFNSSVEDGLVKSDNPPPAISVPTSEQEAALKSAQDASLAADRDFAACSASLDQDLAAWEATAPSELADLPGDPVAIYDFNSAKSIGQHVGTTLELERGIRGSAAKFDATQHVEDWPTLDVDGPWTISVWVKPTGSLSCVWSKIKPTDQRRGMEMIWQKGRLQVNLVHRWSVNELAVTTRDPLVSGGWHHLVVSYDGSRRAAGLHVILNGQDAPLNVQRDTLTGSIDCSEPLRIGRRDSGLGYYGLLDEFRIYAVATNPEEASGWSDSERLRGILERPKADRVAAEQSVLQEYFITHRAPPELHTAWQRMQQAKKEKAAAENSIPTALVMQDLPELRKTHVLTRGEYNKPSDEVRPNVPSVFPALPADAPPNRMALARWLVADDNPLTPRVTVNRLWQMCFGEGLVRTPNDFGSQGETPTHPELLDLLAVRFVESGWDMKAMLRLIVTSSVYRQSSQPSIELLERDPDNRLLARGPRFRLAAELVRDQALAASGLLTRRIGGPSVKPYQPEGLWEAVSYNGEDTYVPDTGGNLWRRSLYSYWKRQAPPPSLMTFDANTREECLVQRSRTNTPLQALVILNDVTYVEAARALAAATLQIDGTDAARMQSMFRRVVSRNPESSELQVLIHLLASQRKAFASARHAAELLIDAGSADILTSSDPSELAAWAQVAQTILNLDEVITRR